MKMEKNTANSNTTLVFIALFFLILVIVLGQITRERNDVIDHQMRLNANSSINVAGIVFKKCVNIKNGNHVFTNTLQKPCILQRLVYDDQLYLLDTWTINPNETVTHHINSWNQLRIFHNKSDVQPTGIHNFNCESKY